MRQVTDSTIELTEKQHSMGSAPHSTDEAAEHVAREAGAAGQSEAHEVCMHAYLLQGHSIVSVTCIVPVCEFAGHL